MSWDVFVQHLPASAVSVDDIPDEFTPLPLGTREQVLTAITSVFSGADASDPNWITVQTTQYALEVGVDAADPIMSLTLHVRGDESVVPAIVALITRLGARAVDSWTGEFFDPATATESIRRWREMISEV